ncbi:MAG: GNAT family N-acetyltransferase [Clostridia bacterium]|nr:GNAT family N-acetyltransferase [Clostridia bacterium]
MVSVRKYDPKDYENVQFACLNSEGPATDPEQTQRFVLITFCNYYIEKEPENCFVLDDDGRAVGYVICAENYDKFKPVFDAEYLTQTLDMPPHRYEWASTSTVLQEKYKEEYPAHLHIYILPEYHRKGYGGQLINALFDHLRSKGVKGVMLTVGERNSTGIGFYKKYGFEFIEQWKDDVAFGMKL